MRFFLSMVFAIIGGSALAQADYPAFSSEEIAWSRTAGSNTIEGDALLRTQDGGVQTCAGTSAVLVPAGKYATSRMMRFYGSSEQGYSVAGQQVQLEAPDPAYVESARKQVCDALGKFKFEDVPDGTYYLQSAVAWVVTTASIKLFSTKPQYQELPQGGTIMMRVEVHNGETKRVVLSQ